ncbi:MAG: DUF6029 family protein [Bacteroidia bacterium]
MKYLIIFFSLLLVFLNSTLLAQEKGQLSGDFTLNASFYDLDSNIGTTTTQYLRELSSADSWLYLDYRYEGWQFNMRYDLFHNSPLLNPIEAYSAQGIGFFSVRKDIDNVNITAGHFYDQIGAGLIYRAFEERQIGLDYATRGVRVEYRPFKDFMIKGFTGQQKNRLGVFDPIIKGASAEYYKKLGKRLSIVPGAGIVNRTIDQSTMQIVADQINSYPLEDRFIPKYNVYAYSFFNRLSYKSIGWYVEYAGKTDDVIRDQGGRLRLRDGNAIYTALNYSRKGFGISGQYRRIDNFEIRTSPEQILLEGLVNYLPSLNRQNAYTLPARYNGAAIAEGEEGVQFEVTWTPKKDNTIMLNFSDIHRLNGEKLFREYLIDYYRKHSINTKTRFGLQAVDYNQEVYEFKPTAPMVQTLTPYVELSQKLDRKKSLRVELQYMITQRNTRINALLNNVFKTNHNETGAEQDLGDFALALAELNIAPKYSISVSDMVNTKPTESEKMVHYYSFFGAFTQKQTRFSLGYVKQVEGVVCTGGVCRVEPAFSGMRFGLTTNF